MNKKANLTELPAGKVDSSRTNGFVDNVSAAMYSISGSRQLSTIDYRIKGEINVHHVADDFFYCISLDEKSAYFDFNLTMICSD